MARVHLLTVHPESDSRARGGYVSILENAHADRFKIHQLVDDPESADLILFAEIETGRLCEYVRPHPYIKRFRSKCFMFSTDWRVVPFLPGVYTALEKSWYLPRRVRPGFYPKCLINPLVKFEPDAPRDLLYSFMGDVNTAPVRRVLAQLKHPRGEWVDTSHESQAVAWKGSAEQREIFWKRYVELAKRSPFILCPRGVAPASIRMYEAMMMGRVPVVLADEWPRPEGPAWDKFCIFVEEKDALSVPRILEEREGEARAMGLLARSEWEKFFSPEVLFHRLVELCLEIKTARRFPEGLARWSIAPQLLRSRHVREFLRLVKQSVKGR